MPHVTVLMAVRNGERTVDQAVESILGQTFRDFDFLVIDDDSTDTTSARLASYNDPRLRVVANDEHLGLTRSLNRGLRLIESDYVARQDADDRSAPERLERQVQFLDEHPDVALVGTWYRKIDEHGQVLETQKLPLTSTELRWHLLYYSPFVHSAVAFRTAALEAVGGYDDNLRYSQDYELWTRIGRRFPVANVDDYLVDWRVWSQSMTSSLGETVEEEPRRIAHAYLRDLYGSAPVPAEPELGTISALLFRPYLLTRSDDVVNAAALALQHYEAFSNFFHLSETERAAGRVELADRLRRRLARIALREVARGRLREAALLVRGAVSVRSR